MRARPGPQLQPCACRIGLEALAWQQQDALPAGSHWLLSLQPGLDSAMSLHLPVIIRSCQAQAGSHVLQAQWHALPDAVQQNWERWVFRGHRQQVGKRR